MSPVHLFSLATQHAHWASVRQSVVAGNIANANTPGYAALDIEPFAAVLNDTALTMARTDPGHYEVGGAGHQESNWEIRDSGTTVALDQEMIKADEVNRAFALDTSVMRSFHRMLMMSVRGGA